jgi:threonine aldolase
VSPSHRHQFASDNNAGICPEAWRALAAANAEGHHAAYGDDPWTARAADRLRELFDIDCDVHFVFNGTAANALALAALAKSYQAVIATPVSHIETDECGAPAFFSGGAKLLLTPAEGAAGRLGKMTADDVETLATRRTDVHGPRAVAVSLTQATEMGTVYTVDEVRAIAAAAKRHALRVHMDGARFANAVATLGVEPADITWRVGVDVLCFGGTKNGLHAGEAVVFFDRALGDDFAYRVKQAGQLASKMRFLAAPWTGMLEGHAWRQHAAHANAMAQRLRGHLAGMSGLELLLPTEANAVFARLPRAVIDSLHADGWRFYEFLSDGGCRLMCSWDTTAESVDEFAEAIARATSAAIASR